MPKQPLCIQQCFGCCLSRAHSDKTLVPCVSNRRRQCRKVSHARRKVLRTWRLAHRRHQGLCERSDKRSASHVSCEQSHAPCACSSCLGRYSATQLHAASLRGSLRCQRETFYPLSHEPTTKPGPKPAQLLSLLHCQPEPHPRIRNKVEVSVGDPKAANLGP